MVQSTVHHWAKTRRGVALLLAAVLLAPLPAGAAEDPLESFNRTMFDFNRGVLTNVVNPAVDYLGPRTPEPVKTALWNAYSNLTEVEFILNGALRRDLGAMATPAKRFAINSTLGVAGLFDVATRLGINRSESDFVESLCQLGLPPGPYLVLPLVGSANLNAAAALAGGVAVEVYALSFISTTLAAADFIIIDLGGSAAGLRYMNKSAEAGGEDPYQSLRAEHMDYVVKGCGNATTPDVAESAPPLDARPFRRAVTPPDRTVPRSILNRITP